jgi:RNA polymerase sigma-70 factor, ECF subfamily
VSPDADGLLDAHRRLIGGDATAPATIFRAVYGPLVGLLLRAFSRLPDDIAADLATDAIVEYLGAPARFDPARASLKTYLTVIAKRDAINWFSKRANHKRLHKKYVELEAPAGNMDGAAEFARLDAETILRDFGPEILDDEKDVAVLKLMLLGEDRTDAYAAAIGLASLSPADQRSAVKKHRDKIEKRLERLGERL